MSKNIIKIDEIFDGEVVDDLPVIWEPTPRWVPHPAAVKRRIKRDAAKKRDREYREEREARQLARKADQEWMRADHQATVENNRMPMTNVHWRQNPPMSVAAVKVILALITVIVIAGFLVLLFSLPFPVR